MLENTARVIHIGLNYVIAPKKEITVDEKLEFQKELSLVGLEAENTAKKKGGIGIKALYEGAPVIVETFMSAPNTGQLLVIMPENPNSALFPQIADAVGDIYLKVFDDPKPHVFQTRDGCVRKLFSCKEEYPHAFKYIWEGMLGKAHSELSTLGSPIAGGGLRFVIPPTQQVPVEKQVRIESSFQDARLLWVELIMKWVKPEKIESGFLARDLYQTMADFFDENVVEFMLTGR